MVCCVILINTLFQHRYDSISLPERNYQKSNTVGHVQETDGLGMATEKIPPQEAGLGGGGGGITAMRATCRYTGSL